MLDKFSRVIRGPEDLDDDQWTCVDFLRDNPFSALWIPLGYGKTIISLTLLDELMLEFEFDKALIIGPTRVVSQTWPEELAEWRHVAHFDYSLIRAEDDDPEVISAYKAAYQEARDWAESPKDAKKIADRAKTDAKEALRRKRAASKAPIHLIDDGHIEWLVNQYLVERTVRTKSGRKKQRMVLENWPYDVIIYDEISRAKDWNTNRHKALIKARHKAKRFYGLTASPAAEGYMGIFAQMYLIDLGERFGRIITPYRDEFFTYNQWKRKYTLLEGAKERIAEKIAPVVLSLPAKRWADANGNPVAEAKILERHASMTEAQTEIYQKFRTEFIVTFEDDEYGEEEEIEAENAASLSGKLLQLASGAIYRQDGTYRVFHDHKLDLLEDVISELQGDPLMLAYWFKSSKERILKRFPKATVMDKTGKCVKPWNAGKIPLLLVHPAGSAYGLNMQLGPGHDLALFDIPWSREKYEQIIGRLDRRGQQQQVRVHPLVTLGTDDTLVLKAQREKGNAQEELKDRVRSIRARLTRRRLVA